MLAPRLRGPPDCAALDPRRSQYHPEFKSRPGKPSPPFLGLVLASKGQLNGYFQGSTQLPPSPSKPTQKPQKE